MDGLVGGVRHAVLMELVLGGRGIWLGVVSWIMVGFL